MSRGQDGLIVALEARVNQFERQMQRAANSNNRAMAQIERRSSMAMRNLNTTLIAGSNQVAGALGAIGVQAQGLGSILGAGGIWAGAAAAAVGYVAALRRVSSSVAEIGARADRVGVATEELQRLRFASEQAAGSAAAVDAGLDRFAKGLSDAARGTGELFQILQANNVAIRDQQGNLISTGQQFRAFADLVKNAANENDQLALAIAAFGRSAGPELVGLLRNGAAGVDELAQAADEAGAVLDDALVRRAQEIDDAFSRLSRTMGTNFKAAILEVAGAARTLFDTLEGVRTGVAAALQATAQRLDAEKSGNIELNELWAERAGLVAALEAASDRGATSVVADIERQIKKTDEQIERVRELQRELARAIAMTPSMRAGVDAAVDAASPDGPAAPTTILPSSGDRPSRGGAAGGRSAAERLNDYEREVQAIQRRTQAMMIDAQATALSQMEADKLRASTELLNAAREAGISLTPELKAQVEQLSTAYAEQAELVRNLEKAQQELQQVAGMVADGMTDVFVGVITGAKNAEQAIGQLLQQLGRLLINRAFQALLNGGPGGGSIFASLFGRATGGPVQAGRAVRVGEFGPETFVPTQPGRIVPADKGGGGRAVVTINQTIAANGDRAVAEIARRATQQGLLSYDRSLPGRISEINMRTG